MYETCDDHHWRACLAVATAGAREPEPAPRERPAAGRTRHAPGAGSGLPRGIEEGDPPARGPCRKGRKPRCGFPSPHARVRVRSRAMRRRSHPLVGGATCVLSLVVRDRPSLLAPILAPAAGIRYYFPRWVRCVVCGTCALAFLRRAPAFLAGSSQGRH